MRTFIAALLIAASVGPVAWAQQSSGPGAGLPTPKATACPKGVPFISPKTRQPLTCNPKGTACPAAYDCVRSTTGTSFQCCSTR